MKMWGKGGNLLDHVNRKKKGQVDATQCDYKENGSEWPVVCFLSAVSSQIITVQRGTGKSNLKSFRPLLGQIKKILCQRSGSEISGRGQ